VTWCGIVAPQASALTVVVWQAGLEKIVITPAMVPSSFPFKLNTSDPTFSSIAPGMAQKYPDTGYGDWVGATPRLRRLAYACVTRGGCVA